MYLVVFRFLGAEAVDFKMCERGSYFITQCLWTTNLLLTRIPHITIGLEKRPDVHRLTSPQMPIYSPVKGEFQAPSVQ